MKKRFCKSLSVLLAVILLFSLFTALPFSVSAVETDKEQIGAKDESVKIGLESTGYSALDNFINDYRFTNGVSWAYNKMPILASFQAWGCCAYCADYVKYCYGYNNPRTGSVFYNANEIRAGDVLTVGNQSDGSGHWFVCLKRSGNSLYVAEGNYSNRVRIGWNYTISGNRFAEDGRNFTAGYHYLSSITPPSNAWLSASTDRIPPGGSISFSYGANDATDYCIGVDLNGNRVLTQGTWEGLWSGKSFSFSEPGTYDVVVTASNSAGWVNSNWVRFSVVPQGHIMSEAEGAGQTIPDGDYWICSKINQNYFVDISGDNFNTTSGTNLNTWIWNNAAVPGKWDAFHFKYLNNGYYRITQINTKMAIDVDGASLYRGTNVQMWAENNSNAQQWSIEKTDKGYKLRSRANSYYLDVYGAYYENNTNVQVWTSNESDAQFFGLIPYAPDERPIKDGIYTIKSQVGDTCYLDASGEPGEYKLDSNVQIWNWDEPEEKYKFEYVGDGYYRIYEVSSGLAVEIFNAGESYLNKNKNAKLYEKNNSRGQFWKIKENSDGTYFIINELSGYYLDVSDGLTANGTNVHAHPYNGSNAQKWFPRRVIQDDMVTVNDVVTNSDATSVNPSVTVKVDGSAINSRFYSVKTNADISNGTGTVTITGKDRFCGSVTKTFNITINDTTVVNDFFGNKFETEKGEIITYYANLTSPIQVNHLNGVIYYNQEVLEPIITNDMNYFAPNFENSHVQPMGAGQLRFDVYSNKPVSLDNTMIIRMQFRVIKKGGETWLGHQFETPEFTYENRDNYGLETHILTKQKLYDPNEIKIGDANGDNTVDVLDAAAIQKHASGISELNSEQLAAADVNGDGNVDVLDAADIQKFAAGKITEFKKKA